MAPHAWGDFQSGERLCKSKAAPALLCKHFAPQFRLEQRLYSNDFSVVTETPSPSELTAEVRERRSEGRPWNSFGRVEETRWPPCGSATTGTGRTRTGDDAAARSRPRRHSMTRYLLDTNISSNATKIAPSKTLVDWIAQQLDDSLYIS